MTPSRILVLSGLALLTLSGTGESQASVPDVRRVRWPLIDLVMAPDSACGVLFLTAPSVSSMQWETGSSSMIQLILDPVYALQWATAARNLLRDDSVAVAAKVIRVAPALRSKEGREFLLLGRKSGGSAKERFVMVVSDSATRTHWKIFAPAAQVDSLLTALEVTATLGWAMAGSRDSSRSESEQNFDQQVKVVSQPTPRYPQELVMRGRVGRVWMMYVVGSDGRPEPDSFQTLLSDDSLFTQSAIETLRRSKFRPARRHGQPVRRRVFQVITFRWK